MPKQRLYHASAFDTALQPDSHWRASAPPLAAETPRLAGEVAADVAVIGGGFTGLWAAYRLAAHHGADVALVDAGEPGWGASGRNGGFCCLGSSKLSYQQIAQRYGKEEMHRFFAAQCESVSTVRQFLDSEGIDADRHSMKGELALAHRPRRMANLEEEGAFLSHHFGLNTKLFSRSDLSSIGAEGPDFHGGLLMDCGFALHPLKYARGLACAASRAAVRLYAHSPVNTWEQTAGKHVLTLPQGKLTADKVILATNGYSREDLPSWMAGRALPVMSSILVTRPLTPEEKTAQGWTSDLMAFDSRRLLHYFRLLPDGRFLFGGRGGIDASPRGVARMERRLRRDFERLFPAWAAIPTERFWFGFLAMTRGLVPYVGRIADRPAAWTAFAFHGNGVAMTSWAGKTLADLAAGTVEQEALPAVFRGPVKPFPLPALRKLYLRAAYLGYGIEDRWL